MGIVSVLAGLLLSSQAAPPDALQRALTNTDAGIRQRAARELALDGVRWEKWLLRQLGSGSPEEERALLLACALYASPPCLAAVEKATEHGRKSDTQRAFALLVYGALHPAAGSAPKEDWKRSVTSYERDCFLAGLLGQARRYESDLWFSLMAKESDLVASAFLEMGDVLLGRAPPLRSEELLSYSGRMLTSLLPEQPGLSGPGSSPGSEPAWEPPLAWWTAARHHPPRALAALRSVPLAGESAAVVLALYELPASQGEELFSHFRTRVQDPAARAWLWGAAGDLGLDLAPTTVETLDPAEVVGLLRLALRDPTAAERAGLARLPAARALFASAEQAEARFPAALVLALAGGPEEQEQLRLALEKAEPRERLDLQPVWKFAQRGFGEVTLQQEWLRLWARRLGGGAQGFLDREAPRWTAYLLAGGTRAASQDPRLQPRLPALEKIVHDHALDVSLHADVIEFLLGGVYRWELPD
jgi:hypothetical protein